VGGRWERGPRKLTKRRVGALAWLKREGLWFEDPILCSEKREGKEKGGGKMERQEPPSDLGLFGARRAARSVTE